MFVGEKKTLIIITLLNKKFKSLYTREKKISLVNQKQNENFLYTINIQFIVTERELYREKIKVFIYF